MNTKERLDPNVHLIAAAPELLEVLERIVRLHEKISSGRMRDWHTIRQKVTHASTDARIIIRKAKGESNESS